jgi:RNA polymerase sigma-70 factor (ECF subfamily)
MSRNAAPEPDSPCADARLLEAVAADPSALAPLYDRYGKLVYGLALAILRSREEAEDLTHEVFVSVCDPSLDGYDRRRGSVGGFLMARTRWRAIDRLRQRCRAARLLQAWRDAEPPAPASQTPVELISLGRLAERVREGLAQLPENQRQVLELAYYGGLSQSEIAADLATPLGTVKSLSRRALLTLERDLAGCKPVWSENGP